MMYPLVLWMLKHERAVLLATVCLALAGVWAIGRTPLDALPDLSENQVLVYVPWPHQRPPEIEQQITAPLATALQGIPGLVTIRGSSEVSFSLLHLVFADNVTFPEARQRVQAKLSTLTLHLPAGVEPQVAADGIPTGQIFWYTVEGSSTDLVELRRVQDQVIAPRLRTISGVAEVASVGGFQAEYQLRIELSKLAAHRASVSELTELTTNSLGSQADDFDEIRLPSGERLQVSDLGQIVLGTSPRSGIFEKDGTEVVAGVVHLRYGHNPLQVTREVIDCLQELSRVLPGNIRALPCYDRTPLILGAVKTVAGTLLESMLVTALCVIIVLRHWLTSLVIALTLPLAVLGAFLAIWTLHAIGLANIQVNIMSLAGIVVSIGVLVDSAIVITDNVSHQLRERFGDQPVSGDTRELVASACAKVGWPAFLAIVVMLVSFLPIFALQGIDGRMYRPLAWTKALSLLSVLILTVSVIPILCHKFIRGRIRAEGESQVVGGFVRVYRPALEYLLEHPLPLILFLTAVLVFGAATTGNDWLLRLACGTGLIGCAFFSSSLRLALLCCSAVLLISITGPALVKPISLSGRMPLDEGMVMDMPITIPNISIAQAGDDLKARNMILCRFPEVAMVSGKAGRAETAFDPAPLDMIETMVEFRPSYLWPSRRLMRKDAVNQTRTAIAALQSAKLIDLGEWSDELVTEIVDTGLLRFDAIQREVCWQRWQAMQSALSRELAIELTQKITDRLEQHSYVKHPLTIAEVRGIATELGSHDVRELGQQPNRITVDRLVKQIIAFVQKNNRVVAGALFDEATLLTWNAKARNACSIASNTSPISLAEELTQELNLISIKRRRGLVQQLNAELQKRAAATWTQIACSELVTRKPIQDDSLRAVFEQVLQLRFGSGVKSEPKSAHEHTGLPSTSRLPFIDPHREYNEMFKWLVDRFALSVWLWPHDHSSLTGAGGELDQSLQMPGWANVWTRPIQNRVDMLASGVNSEVGVRVMGKDFDRVVELSDAIANVLRMVPGAADVVADPIRGKDYDEWFPNAAKFEQLGFKTEDAHAVSLMMPGDLVIGSRRLGTDTVPVKIKVVGDQLDSMGEWKTVLGPATIKSENGWLRNYVRFNVRGHDPQSVITAAKQEIQRQIVIPSGSFLEWTGQYEHALKTRSMLFWMVPVVLLLIGIILYAVFRDAADSMLMLMSIPGALAGGAICQWCLAVPFSVAVGVGYIACFGMAAATSMIMLYYLRESIAHAGGLTNLSPIELRHAVIAGAVQRLRPKLLTEATMIFSLAPMLWSTGAGADVIRPMATPVLGGILIADEVVDLLIPILFYRIRRRRQLVAASNTKESKSC